GAAAIRPIRRHCSEATAVICSAGPTRSSRASGVELTSFAGPIVVLPSDVAQSVLHLLGPHHLVSSRLRFLLLQPADTRLLFTAPNYRRLWAIGGLTGIARWLEFVAVAIFAYELTRSPELVALLAVLRMVPYVLLGFLVGAVADTMDRKRLLLASFTAMVLASSTMAVITAAGAAT